MNPLLIALIISAALNGVLSWLYLGQRDEAVKTGTEVTTVTTQRDAVAEVAQECSQGTEAIATKAAEQKEQGADARQQASARAAQHQQRADAILTKPDPVPDDACASAQVLIDDWLKGREAP